MRLVKVPMLAAFVVCAYLALGAATANAETPAVLCLTAGCVKELEGEFTGGVIITETLGGEVVQSQNSAVRLKGCEPVAGTEEKDVSTCKDVKLVLTGVEEPAKKVKCHTEGAVEGEIVTLIDLQLAAGLNAAQTELQPLGLGKVLNAALEAMPVTIKCGIITIKVRGTYGCLMPSVGLRNIAAGGELATTCKMNKTTHDIETGPCELLCEWLEKEPFEMTNLKGQFEDAAKEFTMKGSANKDVFVDD